MVPTPTSATEAQKTEPDKNTYLVFKRGLAGAEPSYDYGTHFLYQGHEVVAKDPVSGLRQGYIRRNRQLPVERRGRLRRSRPRRLRGHPGRLRRQHLDRRGHRRPREGGYEGQAAE